MSLNKCKLTAAAAILLSSQMVYANTLQLQDNNTNHLDTISASVQKQSLSAVQVKALLLEQNTGRSNHVN